MIENPEEATPKERNKEKSEQSALDSFQRIVNKDFAI
jgi:hypothetical protein